jgi:NTP pyrophosphatase (non-canonical NTP hydrolase)
MAGSSGSDVGVRDFQQLIHRMYFDKDVVRGAEGTFLWLLEEVGELAAAVRHREPENLREEFADVAAWLATLANITNIDLADALRAKYGSGCPGCQQLVCRCPDEEKP